MGAPIEELQRIGIKLFAADGSGVRPREFVPIFHRWIQTAAVAGHLLIDVADYEHVPDGPGVLLVAHEGNFSTDLAAGLGLAYNRKMPLPGALVDRIRAVTQTALAVGQLLENEAELAGRVSFRADRLHVFANDRLLAPHTPTAHEAFGAVVSQVAAELYGGAPYRLTAETDPRERLGCHVTATGTMSVGEALARLA